LLVWSIRSRWYTPHKIRFWTNQILQDYWRDCACWFFFFFATRISFFNGIKEAIQLVIVLAWRFIYLGNPTDNEVICFFFVFIPNANSRVTHQTALQKIISFSRLWRQKDTRLWSFYEHYLTILSIWFLFLTYLTILHYYLFSTFKLCITILLDFALFFFSSPHRFPGNIYIYVKIDEYDNFLAYLTLLHYYLFLFFRSPLLYSFLDFSGIVFTIFCLVCWKLLCFFRFQGVNH